MSDDITALQIKLDKALIFIDGVGNWLAEGEDHDISIKARELLKELEGE
jgi:hypothetical protein